MADAATTNGIPAANPDGTPARPPLLAGMLRGASGACPRCGRGRLFAGWLETAPACTACAAPFGELRPDDATPYFVLLISGHAVLPAMFMARQRFGMSDGALAAVFIPLMLATCLALMRPVKGAVVAVMLRLGMPYRADDEG